MGRFLKDRDAPWGALTNCPRSPIDFHDNNQVLERRCSTRIALCILSRFYRDDGRLASRTIAPEEFDEAARADVIDGWLAGSATRTAMPLQETIHQAVMLYSRVSR
jgi:hypothetical protein